MPLAGLGGRAVHHPRLAAVGVRRRGLRVRLLGRGPRRPGGLGGPVRRLLERRPDHHRQLPGGRRGQVGPDVRPGPAAAPRLRGPGPRALLGPHRAVPDPVRPRQPAGDRADHRGPVLPPAARPRSRGPSAQPLVVFTPKSLLRARQARSPIAAFTSGLVRRGARRSRAPATTRFDPDGGRAGSCSAPARWPSTPWPAATRWATAGRPAWRWSGSSSSTRGPRRPSRPSSTATRTPSEVVWLQEEPENMGAWNFVHGRLHRLLRDTHTPPPREPGRVGQPGHGQRRPAPARAGGPAGPRRSAEPAAAGEARPELGRGQARKSWARAIHISVDRRSDSTSTRSSIPWNMAPYSSKPMARLCRPNP